MRGSIYGRAAAAFCLTISLLSAQLMAAPAPPAGERNRLLGEITSFGQVQVNGLEAASGATVFPDSRYTTAEKSGATVNLGAAGRVQLSSETAATINFGARSLEGALDAGSVMVSKPGNVESRFTTKDTEVVPETESAAVFSLSVTGGNTVVKALSGRVQVRAGGTTKLLAAGESTAVGGQNTPAQDDDDDDDTGGWFWVGVVGFVATVGGVTIWALSNDDDGQGSQGQPIVISPIRG
jgi:ferric-dicitrate binding protein FerR (iron transport regulator)